LSACQAAQQLSLVSIVQQVSFGSKSLAPQEQHVQYSRLLLKQRCMTFCCACCQTVSVELYAEAIKDKQLQL